MISSGECPQANAVARTSEEIAHTPDLLKTRIFGQYVSNLIHCGPPTEALIEVIEYFNRICSPSFTEEFVHFCTQSLGSTPVSYTHLTLPTSDLV